MKKETTMTDFEFKKEVEVGDEMVEISLRRAK